MRDDPGQFLGMCKSLNVIPDVWSLFEWSCWLTPLNLVGQTKRRFDTLFYIHFLADDNVTVQLDNQEVTDHLWTDPDEVMDLHSESKVWLAPPQMYELSRIRNFKKLQDLQAFTVKRESQGCTTWLPVLAKCQDAAIALYPGDDLYPENPDFFGDQKPPSFDQYKIGSDAMQAPNRNRLEINRENETIFINCNLTDPHGFPKPVTNKLRLNDMDRSYWKSFFT